MPFLIYYLVTLYFFVPLLAGIFVVCVAANKGARGLGIALLLIGAIGAFDGVPFWYEHFASEWRTERYFRERCRDSVMDVPATRIPAAGLALYPTPEENLLGDISNLEKFLGPGLGRFDVVQTVTSLRGRQVVDEGKWQPAADPAQLNIAREGRETPSMPYALRVVALGTGLATNNRVEGMEATITEEATGKLVARVLAFRKIGRNPKPGEVGTICPEVPAASAACEVPEGCGLLHAFVFRALQPTSAYSPDSLYHVWRGMAKRRSAFCSDVRMQPGLTMQDIEWWPGAFPDERDLHLGIRGTAAEFVCPRLLGSNPLPVWIRFADGTRVSTSILRQIYERDNSPGRRALTSQGIDCMPRGQTVVRPAC